MHSDQFPFDLVPIRSNQDRQLDKIPFLWYFLFMQTKPRFSSATLRNLKQFAVATLLSLPFLPHLIDPRFQKNDSMPDLSGSLLLYVMPIMFYGLALVVAMNSDVPKNKSINKRHVYIWVAILSAVTAIMFSFIDLSTLEGEQINRLALITVYVASYIAVARDLIDIQYSQQRAARLFLISFFIPLVILLPILYVGGINIYLAFFILYNYSRLFIRAA